MGNHSQALDMTSHHQLILLSTLLTITVGDYHTDHTGSTNYIYPDYQGYGYGATGYGGYNTSVSSFDSRKRRVFDDSTYSLNMAFTIDLTIPIPDLGTEIMVTVPFSVDFPTTTTTTSGRSFTGRSLSSGLESPRASMYGYVEKYMSQVTGADGHACLLRAMCEASAAPLHDEGLLGDAVNFLLTGNYAAEEPDQKFKDYVAAQAQGQLKGDCTEFNADCPISFFKFIDNNIV